MLVLSFWHQSIYFITFFITFNHMSVIKHDDTQVTHSTQLVFAYVLSAGADDPNVDILRV